MNKLKVTKFNPNDIQDNSFIVTIGKKGSGRSTLVKDLCYNMNNKNKFDIVIAISEMAGEKDVFSQFVPDCFIFDSYCNKSFELLIWFLEFIAKNKFQLNVLMIIDHTSLSNNKLRLFENQALERLVLNHQKLGITMILNLQYCIQLPWFIYTRVNYCFSFKESFLSARNRLKHYFFRMFESMNAFSTYHDACTQNYECMVLDNVKNSYNIENNLFFYKANPNIPEFTIGRQNQFGWLEHTLSNEALLTSDLEQLYNDVVCNILTDYIKG